MIHNFSTRQVAKRLGIAHSTLAHYLELGKIPTPEATIPGKRPTHLWTLAEIEHVRQLLPKIANGRKTRYSKLRAKQKAQPRAPQPQHAKSARRGPQSCATKASQT